MDVLSHMIYKIAWTFSYYLLLTRTRRIDQKNREILEKIAGNKTSRRIKKKKRTLRQKRVTDRSCVLNEYDQNNFLKSLTRQFSPTEV